jgi:hypothetical protein
MASIDYKDSSAIHQQIKEKSKKTTGKTLSPRNRKPCHWYFDHVVVRSVFRYG